MLRIGEFSKLSRISIRMLRYYDEAGLLTPSLVDDASGYRYYGEQQLMDAAQITALREMGFGLAATKEIIGSHGDPEELRRLLHVKKLEIEEQAKETAQRLLLLDSAITRLGKDGKPMNYSVTIKELPARTVASVRQQIPAYHYEGKLWELMFQETKDQNMQMATPCYSSAIFHDMDYKEADPDVEIQMTVTGNYKDTEHVRFKEVEAMEIASAVFNGGYEQFSVVTATVYNWIKDNGYEVTGKEFSIYHVSPAQTSNPEEFVTEVCFPVRKK